MTQAAPRMAKPIKCSATLSFSVTAPTATEISPGATADGGGGEWEYFNYQEDISVKKKKKKLKGMPEESELVFVRY